MARIRHFAAVFTAAAALLGGAVATSSSGTQAHHTRADFIWDSTVVGATATPTSSASPSASATGGN